MSGSAACETGCKCGKHAVNNPDERFWERVNTANHPTGCWLWTGSPTRAGYGRIHVQGRDMYAHRFSYTLAHPDESLQGKQIDHICRNRLCVNPSHLRTVNHKQNQEHLPRLGRKSMSGIRGVTWHPATQRWRAQVHHDSKMIHVGLFDTVEEAGEAARLKRLELYTCNDLDREDVSGA